MKDKIARERVSCLMSIIDRLYVKLGLLYDYLGVIEKVEEAKPQTISLVKEKKWFARDSKREANK